MKVALFVHCFFPDHFYGTETYTLEVAKNLLALGYDVTVVSAVFAGEAPQPALLNRYAFDGIPVIAIDKNKLPHRNIRETYWQDDMRAPVRQVLRELACDVVHVTHLINHTAVILEEAAALGIPVVATLTDFFGFCFNNKLEAHDGALCAGPSRFRSNCVACYLKATSGGADTPLRRALTGDGLRGISAAALRLAHAAHIAPAASFHGMVADLNDRPTILFNAYRNYRAMIAPTMFLRDAYVRNGFDPSKFVLSHFGVDIDRAAKKPRAPGAPLLIGFIGQLAAHKGVDLLLEAARDVAPGACRIKIYGPENQDPAYMARLRTLAGAHTEFHGTFPPARMAEIMAEFDLLAIPSTWYENSPLVLLNALATHTPVLVADVQGLTEFVTPGENGWTFRRGDLGDLKTVLATLLAHPERVRVASARTSYVRDTRAMTKDVVAVYEQVTTRRPSPSDRTKESVAR